MVKFAYSFNFSTLLDNWVSFDKTYAFHWIHIIASWDYASDKEHIMSKKREIWLVTLVKQIHINFDAYIKSWISYIITISIRIHFEENSLYSKS